MILSEGKKWNTGKITPNVKNLVNGKNFRIQNYLQVSVGFLNTTQREREFYFQNVFN